jgi:hypothetical protein
MFNLLPFEEKKKLKREYKHRLVVVALLILIIAEGILAVLLVPTIILVTSHEEDLKTRLSEYGALAEEGTGGSFNALLKETTEKLTELSPEKNKALPTEAIIKIVEAKPKGVHVERFTYKAGKDFSTGDIVIEGKSDTREALLLFRKALEGVPGFTTVKLPVSNFAQEKDIPFSMSVIAAFGPKK